MILAWSRCVLWGVIESFAFILNQEKCCRALVMGLIHCNILKRQGMMRILGLFLLCFGMISTEGMAQQQEDERKNILSPRETSEGYDILTNRKSGQTENDILQPSMGVKSRDMPTASECRAMMVHVPASDVNFVPHQGKNSTNAVVPADVSGAVDYFPEGFTMSLGLDIAKQYGLESDFGAFEGTVGAATLHVHKGQVTLNGQPLASESLSGLINLCREHYK